MRANRGQSWVVQGHATARLLKHEQGHFDVSALGMREEHDRTRSLTGTSASDLESKYEVIRTEVNGKIRTANRRYDTQTRHSLDTAAQNRWNASIAAAKSSSTGTIDDLPS